MKRAFPLVLILAFSILASLTLFPGCDELVTKEFYDTVTYNNTYRDSACLTECHSIYRTEITSASYGWEYSGHSDPFTYISSLEDQSAASCGPQCHSREGFLESITDSVFDVHFSAIDCAACHDYHGNWDFSVLDSLQATLVGGEIYSDSRSTICVYCHISVDDVDNQVVDSLLTYQEWIAKATHSSSDAEIIMALNGYEFGEEIDSTSHAGIAGGCLTCHMDSTASISQGGHSFNMRFNDEVNVASCNVPACHNGDWTSAGVDNIQTVFETYSLEPLKNKLIEKGYLTTEGEVDINTYIESKDDVGALYNYLYLRSDKSKGIHNYKYNVALIAASMTQLNLVK